MVTKVNLIKNKKKSLTNFKQHFKDSIKYCLKLKFRKKNIFATILRDGKVFKKYTYCQLQLDKTSIRSPTFLLKFAIILSGELYKFRIRSTEL